MYTEGFESLEEAEKESHRTYGASPDMDRLLRENERLKKSLEKEKFFNKLLDQEIQDLKSSLPNGHANNPSNYWTGRRSVSRSAFYTLLFITLGMAAYIGYGIYYDKKFNYLNLSKNIGITEQPKTTVADVPAPVQTEKQTAPATASVPPPAVKDSVPNIIGTNKTDATEKPTENKKAAVAITPDEEYNEDEVNATLREVITPVKKPAATLPPATKPVATPPVTNTETATLPVAKSATPPDAESKNVTQPAAESRPVIGRYRVASKANFYNIPDENNMRSTFISGNKVVGALEEKNGFIFVEYTNDLGFTSKGWLSKKDLTKE